MNKLFPYFLLIFIYSCTPMVDSRRAAPPQQKKIRVVKKEKRKPGKAGKDESFASKDMEKLIISQRSIDGLIEKYWGVPYKYGATGPNSFDCSGFVKQIYQEAYKLSLPRSSSDQFRSGDYVKRRDLIYGDLVFFCNSKKKINHVGIYIGNNRFAHASTSAGVTISNLANGYYAKRYAGAKRFLKE